MSNERYQSCIEACYDCATECETCATECLQEDDVKMMVRCVQLDRYCADICRTAAAFMTRAGMPGDDRFVAQICRLCADICDACEAECKKHEAEHCQRCAEACRRCAEECRRMAGSAAA